MPRHKSALPIQALVFDADGVIVRPESWFLEPAKRIHGIPKAEFMAFIHGDFKRCTTGALPLEEVLPEYLEGWQVRADVHAFIREWLEHEHAVDHTVLEVIQQIRASGIKCYLGTNQERNRAEYMRREMGLEAVLDGVFASCDLGARKPEAGFYALVQERLELEAHEILLWDDASVNVEGARAAGWRAEVFTAAEQVTQAWAR